MRAGWILPSCIRRSSEMRAISRRIGSNPERMTGSGVSSTIRPPPGPTPWARRLPRVVDDQSGAGRQLQRANVAPFAADDPALHVFAREIDHGDRVLGHVV